MGKPKDAILVSVVQEPVTIMKKVFTLIFTEDQLMTIAACLEYAESDELDDYVEDLPLFNTPVISEDEFIELKNEIIAILKAESK